MPIDIEGLDKIQNKFNKFKFTGKDIKYRFLNMIGVESLELLKMNTPVDTGALREGWVLQQSENEVTIMNDQQDLISFLSMGTIRHIANPFIMRINSQVDNMVMARLELALAESHEFFRKLPGGKGRKFQQVGRTSAGFKGGISFAGRSTLVRAGTGRRQLKRRLSLRRRRGKSIRPARKDVKVG
tara:strand:+ start:323 stop:877 length:555 start_codon:yes stop_codon:yes gene_type:complete